MRIGIRNNTFFIASVIYFLLISTSIANALIDNNPPLPWLSVKGTNFINDKGDKVLLKGVNLSNNVWGSWVAGVSESQEAEKKNPMVRPLRQDAWVLGALDFDLIKNLNGNVVRYAINYELFSEDNPARKDNLDKMEQDIAQFNNRGIYVIICLHIPEGLDVSSDSYEIIKPGNIRLKSIFENQKFWEDTVTLWNYLARGLKDLSGVAGYEIINEPRVPSRIEGGLEQFRNKYNELCQEIRKIDNKHILFIPEYNSRESNPGEKYWSAAYNKMLVDNGEQWIIWERGWVEISDSINNVAYVAHFYEPWGFTAEGGKSFSKEALEGYMISNWSERMQRFPLIITEYGINRNQSVIARKKYLEAVHALFIKYSLSAIYWEYKSKVGPYISSFNIFGIYGQYVDYAKEATREAEGKYFLKPWALEPARKNKFQQLFDNYYCSSPDGPTIMDNLSVKEELQRFFTFK